MYIRGVSKSVTFRRYNKLLKLLADVTGINIPLDIITLNLGALKTRETVVSCEHLRIIFFILKVALH